MKIPMICACLFLIPAVGLAGTIHVPGDYATIQEAIDASFDGDLVLVWPGTYVENIDFHGRDITLKSKQGPVVTIIDGSNPTDPAEGAVVTFRQHNDENTVIDGFTITNGTGSDLDFRTHGGGIVSIWSSATIRNNIIIGNSAEIGGGIVCYWGNDAQPKIINNLIIGNEAEQVGGAVYTFSTDVTVINNTIVGNSAGDSGGGLYLSGGYVGNDLTITSSIIRGNDAPEGADIYVEQPDPGPDVTYCNVQGGWSGTGNLNTDPLFFDGPLGEHYLSQVVSGQTSDSPCVDAGDPAAGLIGGTTRTDSVQDLSVVDMGFHFPVYPGPARLVTGPGPGLANPPLVRVFPPEMAAVYEEEFSSYGASSYGVNVTCGNVSGDGLDEILTGAGPGHIYGPHVRGFQVDGTPLPGLSFLAYGTNHWGVNVAVGDLDGDGFGEIITGAGPGAVFGPHVRGWNYDNDSLVTPMAGVSFFAYGTPKWGVNVSAGDIDGDGYDEIVTGAGPGSVYGPHVRGWDIDGGTATPMSDCSFFAYGTHKYGVNVSCGDVDGDGIDEIVTAPGPGAVFGAHVRGFEMNSTPMPGLSFFAWSPDDIRYGATVFAGADLDGDGWNEIVVGQGPDPDASGEVKIFQYDGSQVTEWFWLEAFPGMPHGTNVAAGRF